MNPLKIAERLALASGAAALLLLGLAYWWLSNLVHEIAGTFLFLLLARHVYINRSWFRNLRRGKYDTRRRIIVLLHAAIIANMLVLFATSLAISQSVFTFLDIPETVTVRDLHWVAAYWLAIIVGIHLGLHWTRVMALVRTALGVSGTSPLRTFALRFAALAMAMSGAWSFVILGVGTKLRWTRSIDFWDFTASVVPFFSHWAGVIALPAVLTYYALRWLSRGGQRRQVPPANFIQPDAQR